MFNSRTTPSRLQTSRSSGSAQSYASAYGSALSLTTTAVSVPPSLTCLTPGAVFLWKISVFLRDFPDPSELPTERPAVGSPNMSSKVDVLKSTQLDEHAATEILSLAKAVFKTLMPKDSEAWNAVLENRRQEPSYCLSREKFPMSKDSSMLLTNVR
ncbi:hypothetical protein GEMRC1_004135 [Eukaryota sp. GEM-RC1]